MPIRDLFSKRKRRAATGGPPERLAYDALPQAFRVQVIYIWRAAIGVWAEEPEMWAGGSHYRQTIADQLWPAIHRGVAKELGLFRLADKASPFDACCEFLLKADTDQALDLIEESFRAIDQFVRKFPHLWEPQGSISQDPDSAIEELNARFAEHRIGYQYVAGNIVRVDSQYLHADVVQPAVTLLGDAEFQGAEDEFAEALRCNRQRDFKGAVSNALKALESTIKTICDRKGWTYPRNATALPLLRIMFEKGLLPTAMDSHFAGLRTALESGLPTVRNTSSAAHGQGATPVEVPPSLAAYAIHTAAADIVLLVEAFKGR